MEGNALAQVEPPAFAVTDGFPRRCQRGLDAHVRAATDQTFVDVVQETQNRGRVYCMGVQRLRVGCASHLKSAAEATDALSANAASAVDVVRNMFPSRVM